MVTSRQPSDAELRLSYALSRQVPDMDRGFTVVTNYGEIEVVAGPVAERIQAAIREAIQKELAALELQG